MSTPSILVAALTTGAATLRAEATTVRARGLHHLADGYDAAATQLEATATECGRATSRALQSVYLTRLADSTAIGRVRTTALRLSAVLDNQPLAGDRVTATGFTAADGRPIQF